MAGSNDEEPRRGRQHVEEITEVVKDPEKHGFATSIYLNIHLILYNFEEHL